MGTFTHPITLRAVPGNRTEVLHAKVGAGATFSVFPAPVLEALSVEPHRSRETGFKARSYETKVIKWARSLMPSLSIQPMATTRKL